MAELAEIQKTSRESHEFAADPYVQEKLQLIQSHLKRFNQYKNQSKKDSEWRLVEWSWDSLKNYLPTARRFKSEGGT